MFVSRYPHNLSLGEVEYKILRKLLANQELTEEEETRADQMSRTLEQNEQNAREHTVRPHRHRVPSQARDVESPELQEQFSDEEQFSPS